MLGPLEVRREGTVVELTRPKLRGLLAVLLLDANRIVPRDRLVDALWGDNPPATVGTALHSLVSQLRRALGPAILLTRPPGYLLRLEGASFDLLRFNELHRWGQEALRAATMTSLQTCWARRSTCGAGSRWPTACSRRGYGQR